MEKYAEFMFATGIFINAILALLSYIESRRTSKDIKVLEQNTNSIKDALIKTTGEAEHAKGKLAGAAEERERKE